MKAHPGVALACLLLAAAPSVARGQALPAPLLAPDSTRTAPAVLNERGESPAQWHSARATQGIAQDTTRARQENEPSFIRHVGFGLLAGLLIGGGIGLHGDLNCRDCMFPATPYYAAIGAGLGGLVGLTIWNLRSDP